MLKANRKTWEKPELIVLSRHNPEEAVLTTCKYYHVGPAAEQNHNDECFWDIWVCNLCLSSSES